MTTTADNTMTQRIVARLENDLAVEIPSVDFDMIAAGVLDSLALVNLVVGLEDDFGISIPIGEFDVENYRTVTAIVAHLRTLSPR